MIAITFVTNGNKVVTAEDNTNLLRISLREKGGIPFKCGGGLCGTCRCHIDRGLENTDEVKAKERNHLTAEDLANGYRMACQTFIVKGEVSVSWDPKKQSPRPAIDREGLILARPAARPEPSTFPPTGGDAPRSATGESTS